MLNIIKAIGNKKLETKSTIWASSLLKENLNLFNLTIQFLNKNYLY